MAADPDEKITFASQISRRASCAILAALPFSSVAANEKPDQIPSKGLPDSMTFRSAGTGAQRRQIADKLSDMALSVMDFMTPEQAESVRARHGNIDVTDAINAAFDAATRAGRTVFMPDGLYIVGNLNFGSQGTNAASAAPLGLLGQSKLGTTLRARHGLTGTLLKSWSLTGVIFSDFSIETTATTALAWDCQWMPGAGPSTQNIIHNIMVTGGSAPLHVNLNNLNDTYPTGVTVRVDEGAMASCGISMVQSGGLSLLRECIWSNCYLRFGTQNGKIDGCWGHGIEFAAASVNHVEISASYIYSNVAHDSVLWSQSYDPFQSVRALVCTSSQFITESKPVSAYFDLNAYSILKFTGCQWIGPTVPLLGKRSRRDSYANVLVKIEGGTHTGHLVLADVPGFEIECEAFINDATGRMVTKNRSGVFTPIIQGDGPKQGTYKPGSGSYGRYHRRGNTVAFKLRIQWSAHSAAAGPHVHPQVTGLPLDYDSYGVDSVILEYAGSTFANSNMRPTLSGGVIGFYTADGNPVTLPTAGDLILSGTFSVKA